MEADTQRDWRARWSARAGTWLLLVGDSHVAGERSLSSFRCRRWHFAIRRGVSSTTLRGRLRQLPSGPRTSSRQAAGRLPVGCLSVRSSPPDVAPVSPSLSPIWKCETERDGMEWEWTGLGRAAIGRRVTCNVIIGAQCPVSNWIWRRCRGSVVVVSCPAASYDFFPWWHPAVPEGTWGSVRYMKASSFHQRHIHMLSVLFTVFLQDTALGLAPTCGISGCLSTI